MRLEDILTSIDERGENELAGLRVDFSASVATVLYDR